MASENHKTRRVAGIERNVLPKGSFDRICEDAPWFPPYPNWAWALVLCDNGEYYDESDERCSSPYYFWIAMCPHKDGGCELVRIGEMGEIVERYIGRYDYFDDAYLAANTLAKTWNQNTHDHLIRAAADERDLSRALKVNPWARAVYERKHPDGPVLVIWHMEPLPLYVASWLPFAGAQCIPVLADFAYEANPARVNIVVDDLAEQVFANGPSAKIVGRARSIAAAYAANGAKGGRPRKGAKPEKRL